MIIDHADCRAYNLPLRRVWQTHAGSLHQRAGWIVTLEADGYTGHGDCAPLPAAGTETREIAIDWLHNQLSQLCGLSPEAALQALPDPDASPPAARCGLETALIDLCAQHQQLPLARWLHPNAAAEVAVNASLGQLDHGLLARALEAASQGFRVLKIKVGVASNIDQEIQTLMRLSAQLPEGVRLRLDANQAWSEPAARHFIQSLRQLPIDALEEPLAEPNPIALTALQRLAPYPLAIDESLNPSKLKQLAEMHAVRRIVIKPMCVGGLLPALELANQARKYSMQSIITSTVDSAWGVAAAIHLAAALPGARHLGHGLATSAWLAEDLAAPPMIKAGYVKVPTGAGLGLEVCVD